MYDTATEISNYFITSIFFVDGPGESVEQRCRRLFENAYKEY